MVVLEILDHRSFTGLKDQLKLFEYKSIVTPGFWLACVNRRESVLRPPKSFLR